MIWISRRPEGSGRAARHTYPGRSSIEPTTILLKKQNYRLIGIGPFTCRDIASAIGYRAQWLQIKTSGRRRRSRSRRRRGAKLGADPSNTESDFVMQRRLQSHRSIVVGDALATQKMTNCPLIEGLLLPCDLCGGAQASLMCKRQRRRE
jgi:hypothetical protein